MDTSKAKAEQSEVASKRPGRRGAVDEAARVPLTMSVETGIRLVRELDMMSAGTVVPEAAESSDAMRQSADVGDFGYMTMSGTPIPLFMWIAFATKHKINRRTREQLIAAGFIKRSTDRPALFLPPAVEVRPLWPEGRHGSDALVELLEEAKARHFFHFPNLVGKPTSWWRGRVLQNDHYLPALTKVASESAGEIEIVVDELAGTRVPSFYPKGKTAPVDRASLALMIPGSSATHELYWEQAQADWSFALSIVKKYTLTNGSMYSAVHRMFRGFQLSTNLAAARRQEKPNDHLEKVTFSMSGSSVLYPGLRRVVGTSDRGAKAHVFFRWLDKMVGWGRSAGWSDAKQPVPLLTGKILVDLNAAETAGRKLLRVNWASAAGFPFMGKREDHEASIMIHAQQILNNLESNDLFYGENLDGFEGAHWYRLTMAKGKYEVSDIDRSVAEAPATSCAGKDPGYDARDLKQRFIFVCPASVQMVMGILIENLLSHPTWDGSASLFGFSPMHGGLGVLLAVLREYRRAYQEGEPGHAGPCLFWYADNVYLYDPIRDYWASLDATKWESCHMAGDIQLFADYVRWRLSSIGHAKCYDRYVNRVWAPAVSDSHTVLYNQRFRLPGIPSGSQGTFHCNHFHMAYLIYWIYHEYNVVDDVAYAQKDQFLNKVDGKWSLSPRFQSLCRMVGVEFKVELVSENFLERVDYEPTQVFERRVIEMDLLGFDVCQTSFKDEDGDLTTDSVPVLNMKRLMRAYLFNKGSVDKRSGGLAMSPPVAAFISLAKSRSLYLLGGWSHDSMAMALIKKAVAARDILNEKFGVDPLALRRSLAENLSVEFEKMGIEPDDIQQYAGLNYLPGLVDVIFMLCGPLSAINFFNTVVADPQLRACITGEQHGDVDLSALMGPSVFGELREGIQTAHGVVHMHGPPGELPMNTPRYVFPSTYEAIPDEWVELMPTSPSVKPPGKKLVFTPTEKFTSDPVKDFIGVKKTKDAEFVLTVVDNAPEWASRLQAAVAAHNVNKQPILVTKADLNRFDDFVNVPLGKILAQCSALARTARVPVRFITHVVPGVMGCFRFEEERDPPVYIRARCPENVSVLLGPFKYPTLADMKGLVRLGKAFGLMGEFDAPSLDEEIEIPDEVGAKLIAAVKEKRSAILDVEKAGGSRPYVDTYANTLAEWKRAHARASEARSQIARIAAMYRKIAQNTELEGPDEALARLQRAKPAQREASDLPAAVE